LHSVDGVLDVLQRLGGDGGHHLVASAYRASDGAFLLAQNRQHVARDIGDTHDLAGSGGCYLPYWPYCGVEWR
jgi:hypothetical protein